MVKICDSGLCLQLAHSVLFIVWARSYEKSILNMFHSCELNINSFVSLNTDDCCIKKVFHVREENLDTRVTDTNQIC